MLVKRLAAFPLPPSRSPLLLSLCIMLAFDSRNTTSKKCQLACSVCAAEISPAQVLITVKAFSAFTPRLNISLSGACSTTHSADPCHFHLSAPAWLAPRTSARIAIFHRLSARTASQPGPAAEGGVPRMTFRASLRRACARCRQMYCDSPQLDASPDPSEGRLGMVLIWQRGEGRGWGGVGRGAGRALVSSMTRLIGDWEMALSMWQTAPLSPIYSTYCTVFIVFTVSRFSTHFLCKTK